ncbi:MAG: hypothetical protein AAB576_11885, partial [Elusimicrobiota bacterium]
YHRVMESEHVFPKKKRELQRIYESLNPAELKRTIDKELDMLYATYQKKNTSRKVEPKKKRKPDGKDAPISLYPLSYEEAVKALLGTPPPEKKTR